MTFIKGFLGKVGSLMLLVGLGINPVLLYSLCCFHRFLLYSSASFLCFQFAWMGMISSSILQMLNLGNPYVLHSRIAWKS